MEQKKWSCKLHDVHHPLNQTSAKDHRDSGAHCSTIAYDTLIRAGIECTSAFIPRGLSPYGSSDTSPPLAVCSRQVKILPDITLDPLSAGPVGIFHLFLSVSKLKLMILYSFRRSMMPSSFPVAWGVPSRWQNRQRCKTLFALTTTTQRSGLLA